MGSYRIVSLTLLLSFSAWGADLPQGALPTIDGKIGAEEWAGAYKMPVPHGTAYLRISGRTLCIAVEVQRAYTGQRIELRTSDPAGDRLTLVQMHPACFIPRPPFSALPPLLMRQSTWTDRGKARFSPPYSAKLRARVLEKDAKSWSAECCIALECLDLPIGQPAVFNLTITQPFTKSARPLATPPAQWEPLKAKWDPKADLFMTPEEDKVHAWAQRLFSEGVDLARQRAPQEPMLAAAFDEQMDEQKVKELLAMAELEVKIAPSRYHGLWYQLHLLRRANRLQEADAVYRALIERLPGAKRIEPVLQERNVALLTECRFDDFERENRGIDSKTMNWVQELRTAWEYELARRKREAKAPGARLILKTTRGDVEIQMYRFQEKGYDELLQQWLGDTQLTGKAPKSATGALGTAWSGLPTKWRAPQTENPPSAWRGSVAIPGDGTLLLATGAVHITMRSYAIGYILKGMEHVDAMTAADRIESVKVVPAAARAEGD